MVKSGWLPEKTFAALPLDKHAAVCIEGISVSEWLAGFFLGRQVNDDFWLQNRVGKFGVLLSVRGVRGLRTTVSRSDLEEDEELMKVARICGEMLFEHIKDELNRIAVESGKPLSRASTAGKWLCEDLMAPMTSKQVKDHVSRLRAELPLIVMETSSEGGEGERTRRELASPDSLRGLSHFWTIESRLVDSLRTISRDLGSELSLFEFLNALAPDYRELRYSPILPDAHVFGDDIRNHHRPAEVQFSRRHQQTTIRWVPGEDLDSLAKLFSFDDKALAQKISEEIRRLSEVEGMDLSRFGGERAIAIAALTGDENKISAVITRVVTVLATASEVAKVWQAIIDAAQYGKNVKDARLCALTLTLRNFFRF